MLQQIATNKTFDRLMIGLIFFSAALVGAETYPGIVSEHGHLLHMLDRLVVFAFTLEQIIRIGAVWPKPGSYLRDPWNIFDLTVVALCLLPIDAQYVAVLRLVRILRVLRLVKAIPRLRIIVTALLSSMGSIGYVGLLLGLMMFIFSILGNTLFASVDPTRFGNLHHSMLTMFGVLTMEGWVDLMDTLRPHHPLITPLFFIVFILVGTLVMLNLVVGVIVNATTEASDEVADDNLADSVAAADPNAETRKAISALRVQLDALEKRIKT